MDQIKYMVSVICITYNHEPYLKRALDGVLMQKVNFPMQVIIAEDCSTDDSRRIIDQYCVKYPDFFEVIYREKNVGPTKNLKEAKDLAVGKYLIYLETDDCWTDPKKLQKQVDWLESHPDTIAVTHRCRMIGHNDEVLDIEYPAIQKGYYTFKDYIKDIMPGQTTTMLVRNYYKYPFFDSSLTDAQDRAKGPGDRRRYFMLMNQGKIYCLDTCMSDYRFVQNKGTSFTATNKSSIKDDILYYKEFVKYSEKINAKKEACMVAEALYMRAIWIAFLHGKEISLKQLIREYSNSRYKLYDTVVVIKFYTRRLLRGKSYYYKKKR